MVVALSFWGERWLHLHAFIIQISKTAFRLWGKRERERESSHNGSPQWIKSRAGRDWYTVRVWGLTFVRRMLPWIPLSLTLMVSCLSESSGRRKGGWIATAGLFLGATMYLLRCDVRSGPIVLCYSVVLQWCKNSTILNISYSTVHCLETPGQCLMQTFNCTSLLTTPAY